MGLFTSEPTPIERAVIKATDETLTTEDWTRIIEVCDEVNTKPSKIAPIAVQALKKRLAVPNGNVQLYSLTLLNALAQNCGPSAQREIASAPMTSSLSALGLSPATHRTVLVRLLDILEQLSSQFASDPTLAQIQMVYEKVARVHPNLANPSKSSAKPSKSHKKSHTKSHAHSEASREPVRAPVADDDDEDLRRAMELSLKEMGRPQLDPSASVAAEVEAAVSHAPNSPKTLVRALYDFTATEEGELSFRTGDVLEVTERVYKEWWKGLLDGREGIFPVNYVEDVASSAGAGASSAQDLSSLASVDPKDITEEYIFAQVPAVEKLLSILASAGQSGAGSSIIGNSDVQQLYHRVASMRPRLVQLIEEYALKKRELVDLNQKLLQAHRGYEHLLADAATGHRQPIQAAPTTHSMHSLQSVQSVPSAYGGQSPHVAHAAHTAQSTGHSVLSNGAHPAEAGYAYSNHYAQSPLATGWSTQHPLAQQPTSYQAQSPQYTPQFTQSQLAQSPQLGQSPRLQSQQPPQGHSFAQPQAVPPQTMPPQTGSQPAQLPSQLPSQPLTQPHSVSQPLAQGLPQQGYRLPYPDDRTAPYANGVASGQI